MSDQKKLTNYYRKNIIPQESPIKKNISEDSKLLKRTTSKLTLDHLIKPRSNSSPVKDVKFLEVNSKKVTDMTNYEENYDDENLLMNIESKLDRPIFNTPINSSNCTLVPKIPSTPVKKCFETNINGACTPKTLNFDGVEKSKKTIPAYKRYAHHYCRKTQKIVNDAAGHMLNSVSTYIPYHYKRLYDAFCSCDSILLVFKRRCELCDFTKLKNGVEMMTKVQFTKYNLSQMLYIMPDCYKIQYNKNSENDYELFVELIDPPNGSTDYTSFIAERRDILHKALMDRTHYYHQEFLKELNLDICEEDVKRWHPRFLVEEIPDIECFELPDEPQPKIYTAKEMLKFACFKDNQKIIEVLKMIPDEAKPRPEEFPKAKAELSFEKFIPLDILERIRNKERINDAINLCRDAETERYIMKVERLPTVMRCLNNIFLTKNKPFLPTDFVLTKLKDSILPDFSYEDIQSHIEIILTNVKNWLKVVNLHGMPYIGICNKSLNINQAIEIIQECSRVLKRS